MSRDEVVIITSAVVAENMKVTGLYIKSPKSTIGQAVSRTISREALKRCSWVVLGERKSIGY